MLSSHLTGHPTKTKKKNNLRSSIFESKIAKTMKKTYKSMLLSKI